MVSIFVSNRVDGVHLAKAEEEKIELARKMLTAKEPLEKITEYTGLSIDEIQAL